MTNDPLTNSDIAMHGGTRGGEDPVLSEMQSAYEAVKKSVSDGGSLLPKSDGNYAHWYLEKLVILRTILDMPDPLIVPVLDAKAPMGHSHPIINEGLMLPPGEDIRILEDLADLGLLKRALHNHVNLCPGCRPW